MTNAIELSLWIGPVVPIKATQTMIDALQSVKVTARAVGTSGFELNFLVDVDSPLQTIFLLAGGAIPPVMRVVVAVTLNGSMNVLIDGVMTDHHIGTDVQNGRTTLTVIGEDLTRVMDLFDTSGLPLPAMPPEAQVALLLVKYLVLGVTPMVIPSVLIDVPLPIDRIPRQKGTDLKHIRRLADQVGYVFYQDPGPQPGQSIAYWGPQIKVGPVQPALALDADAYTNVEHLQFTFKNTRKALPIVTIQEPITKTPIPIAVGDITPLNPPLGAIEPIPTRIDITKGAAKWSAMRAALIAMARASTSAEAVSASGTLNVLRYGQVLKPRSLVGLRGAGLAFDGLYYVNGVTHQIKRGEYKQDFELSRNGLVSTLGSIPS
ncbi:hypothetical protein ACFSHT_37365 [Paraburkholderia silviterrae]|uniref:Phage protein D n=1 Tax=Paraburkholderia silviterrae TaxID=2528715 RepID=A0A4V2ZXW6_9BURK|nr:hypothetical protein [Paraburkholderia silviterrae]TDG17365.1 hypothetical protein EYW47_38040 [Paraburkholderia silviterrae]